MTGSAIDRLTPGDMVVLASDVGPAPAQVAVLLDVDGRGDRVAADISAVLGQRVGAIPPLLQHPARVGPFQGRPVWVRDRDLDVGRHLRTTRLETTGVQARLDAAATLMTRRLTLAHPPWCFDVLVQPDGSVSVAAVMHHVVADGMRGLAMLAGLTDEGGAFPAPEAARADLPPGRTLALDAAREHVRAVASVVRPSGALTTLREELKHGRPPSAPPTSLNRPTGACRRVAALDHPLGPLLEAAHAHGATVNDLLLVAVTQALGAELGRRGEHPDRLIVSVPVALAAGLRSQSGAGNAVGVMPVEVPLVGELRDRLAQVAARTRERRASAHSGSAALVGPAFRLLGWLGAFRSVATRQRVVNTFVSNMRGPVEPLHIAGHAVTRVVPMGAASGNIGAQALALSYAGTLTIAVVHDPDLLPDAVPVIEDLSTALAALT